MPRLVLSPHFNTTFMNEKASPESHISHISHISGLRAASVCHHLVCCGVSVYPPRTHPGLTLGGTLFVRLMSCAKPFLPISERQSLRYNTTDTTIQPIPWPLASQQCASSTYRDRLFQAGASYLFRDFLRTPSYQSVKYLDKICTIDTTDTTIQYLGVTVYVVHAS